MSPRPPLARLSQVLVWAAALATVSGCARLPRIDPSGERVFIWPQNEAQVAPVAGNTLAPPVGTDAVFPQPALQTTTPQASPPPQYSQQATFAAKPTQDTLRISPDRFLAPVGAEVILKAGICCTEGHLLTDQRIDWLLASGVGDFVALGGRGLLQPAVMPFNKPKKVDNRYARGYTSKLRRTITRGTPDQRDDVVVLPGESWASLTSPTEGISHITAVTPVIQEWNTRRAQATVYWVDAQWTFPAATVSATCADSHTLTTTVRRQSDGMPVEGWVVRYEVIGGAAGSGGSGNQVVEMRTDAEGNASIEVTPGAGTGGMTRIDSQLVRPAGLGGSEWPRLVVSQSTTTVSWPGGTAPYIPAGEGFGSAPGTYTPPTTGGSSTLPDYPAQTSVPPDTRRPVLELEVFGDENVEVGGTARFEIVIRNTGDAPATGIVLNDQFDSGFSHLADPNRNMQIERRLEGTLDVGQTRSVILNFDVRRAGELCHDVSITSAESTVPVRKRVCVTAAQALPQQQASVELLKQGPRQSTVGEVALFAVNVKNTGPVPLTNVQVVDEYDQSLSATPVTPGWEVVNRSFVWKVERLEPGESRRYEVQAQCLAATPRACSRSRVVSAEGVDRVEEHCVEVLDQLGGAGGGGAAAPAQSNLRLEITSFNNTVRQGGRTYCEVRLSNTTQGPDENVQLQVTFSPELTPDQSAVRADVGSTLMGNEVRFNAVTYMRPGDLLRFSIPFTASRTGMGSISAKVISNRVPAGVTASQEIEVISP